MQKPANSNKTGQVTISRDNRHTMSFCIVRCFIVDLVCWTALMAVICIAATSLQPENLFDTSVGPYLIAALLGFNLLFSVPASFGNMGSMVEQVCFDYDARQVVISCTNMRNEPREVTIPFDRFWFDQHEPHYSRYANNRLRFYNGKKKVAVAVMLCFGWDEKRCDRLADELSGFYVEHHTKKRK